MTKETLPQEDIHALQLHVLASNTGQNNEVFWRVAAVNEIADRNWQKYRTAETTVMVGGTLIKIGTSKYELNFVHSSLAYLVFYRKTPPSGTQRHSPKR